MGMRNVLTSTLKAGRDGTYSATEPVLAMPGRWMLRFRIVPRAGAPIIVALADRISGSERISRSPARPPR
jgi:hypothetical protein